MWNSWLTPVLLMFGITQSSHTQHDLTCVNDYVTTVSCEWQVRGHEGDNCTLMGERDTYKGRKIQQCQLESLSINHYKTRSCNITYSLNFNFAEKMVLLVMCNQRSVSNLTQYHFGSHVKLQQPGKPSVVGGNITWSQGSPFPDSITNYEFELQLRHKEQSWKDVRPRRVEGMFTVLDEDSVRFGERYEARVRVKPTEPSTTGQIRGQWSDWSPAVTWISEIGMSRESQNFTLGLLLVITGMTLIPLIICSFLTHKWVRKTLGQHVPDPSKYFQPLLKVHDGNFQKWLGPDHSTRSSLRPQSCTCDISPVEVTEASTSALDFTALLHTNQTSLFQPSCSSSQSQSSGFSNMGYFYSELQSGSLYLESCPVYFSYRPEGGSSGPAQSVSSYKHLQDLNHRQGEPLSPDSGFDMEEKNVEEESSEVTEDGTQMCRGVNVRHLVSFVLSLPESSRFTSADTHVPVSFSQLPELPPGLEDSDVPVITKPSEPAEGAVVRPSSAVVQPCTSGYLSLKDMQKYSNKSI